MGTLYPIISEYITGIRFNVQAPYFNSFAPYIGFFFIILITLGNLFRRKKKYSYIKPKQIIIAGVLSTLFTLAFCYQGEVFKTKSLYGFSLQITGIYLCFLSAMLLSYDLLQQFKIKKMNKLRPVGSFLSHIGLLISILGFLGNYRGLSQLQTLHRSEKFSFYHYQFKFKGLEVLQEDNVLFYKAPIEFKKAGKSYGTIYPARAKYPTKKELIHEVDYYSNFWHDIYVTLIDFDQKAGLWATLEFHINPSVRLVWISLVFLALGGFISLTSSFKKET